MVNPWLKLSSKPPYILKEDKDIIAKFNKKANSYHKIFINLLAEPYCGDPFKAKIILLQLNPGVDNPIGYEDDKDDFVCELFPRYKKDILKSIWHKENKYPFFELNPEYRLLGGFRYWSKKFSPFIKSKEDYARIANRACVIEFFPYHSRNYRYLGRTLECQKYNFKLVEMAIKRRAIIILMRGKNQWLPNVPKLKQYKYITLKSSRNVILSKANLGKNFNSVKNILNS